MINRVSLVLVHSKADLNRLIWFLTAPYGASVKLLTFPSSSLKQLTALQSLYRERNSTVAADSCQEAQVCVFCPSSQERQVNWWLILMIMMCWRLHRSFLVANISCCSGESTEPFLNSSDQMDGWFSHLISGTLVTSINFSPPWNEFYGAIFGHLRAKVLSSVQN